MVESLLIGGHADMVAIADLTADDLPAVDDHLVLPGTPYVMLDGELVYVAPCDKVRGVRRARLATLAQVYVAPAFDVACELLTRTSEVDDFAMDISIFPGAPDPKTGRRQLQDLAFEIVSTQTLTLARIKAAKFARRGVRRSFVIDLRRTQVLEWSPELDDWSVLPSTGYVYDPTLEVPLPIAALLDEEPLDELMWAALIAKGNPVMASYRAEVHANDHAEGCAEAKAKGMAESLLIVLESRNLAVDAASQHRILDERDLVRLERWIVRAASYQSVADVLAEP